MDDFKEKSLGEELPETEEIVADDQPMTTDEAVEEAVEDAVEDAVEEAVDEAEKSELEVDYDSAEADETDDFEETDLEESEVLEEAEPETEEDYLQEEPLSPEELAARRKKRNKILLICAVVALVVAFAAYWVCRVEGVGTKTIVSTALMSEEGVDPAKDNIRFENPAMAVVNTFTGKKDDVVVINGKGVSKNVFEFATSSSAINCLASLMQMGLLTDIDEFDWNAPAFDGEMSYIDYAKGMAVQNLIPIYALVSEGEERGIALDEEDEKQITEGLEKLKAQYGDDFESALIQSGYSSEEILVDMQRLQMLMNKVYEDATKDLSKYVSSDELAKAEEQEKVTVKHILIAFDEEGLGDQSDEKKAAAKKEAEEVLKKLEEGQDFDKLLEEHNDDPGATAEGYTFADDGTMVQQFTDAAFALKVGETSGLVETSYGYHIIRRMERSFSVDDYIEYLAKEVDVSIRKGNYNKAAISADIKAVFGL